MDGEAVWAGKDGRSDFDRLHSHAHDDQVFLYAFDLLELNGEDYRHHPLEWTLHGVMLDEALKRNPRYQELEEELKAARGGQPTFEALSRFVKQHVEDEQRQAVHPDTTFDHFGSIGGFIPPSISFTSSRRAVDSNAQHRKHINQLQCPITSCCSPVNVLSDHGMKAPSQLQSIRFSSFGKQPFQHTIEIYQLQATGWQGLFAPAGTPAPIIDKLADEVSRIFALPEVVSALQKVGGEALPMRPGEFAQFVRAERNKWAEVVKSAGIRID